MPDRPSVLFVCVKNGGKSQMAAALMRDIAGPEVEVHSAGTHPGASINAQSAAALAEVGIGMEGEHPKPIDPRVLASVDLVIVLGTDAVVDQRPGMRVVTWETDEPSTRGIDGMERMRLVRDDVTSRVRQLVQELTWA